MSDTLVFKKTKPPAWQPDVTDYVATADGFRFVITMVPEKDGHTSGFLMVKNGDGALLANRGLFHSLDEGKALAAKVHAEFMKDRA